MFLVFLVESVIDHIEQCHGLGYRRTKEYERDNSNFPSVC